MSILFDLLADFLGDIVDWLIERFTGKKDAAPQKSSPSKIEQIKKTRYPRLLVWMPGFYFSLFQNFLHRLFRRFRPFWPAQSIRLSRALLLPPLRFGQQALDDLLFSLPGCIESVEVSKQLLAVFLHKIKPTAPLSQSFLNPVGRLRGSAAGGVDDVCLILPQMRKLSPHRLHQLYVGFPVQLIARNCPAKRLLFAGSKNDVVHLVSFPHRFPPRLQKPRAHNAVHNHIVSTASIALGSLQKGLYHNLILLVRLRQMGWNRPLAKAGDRNRQCAAAPTAPMWTHLPR